MKNINAELIKHKRRFNNLKQLDKHFKMSKNIDSIEEYIEFMNSPINIKHIYCGHEEIISLNRWFEKGKKLHYLKNITNDSVFKCPICLQKAKNEYFNNKLQKSVNSDYELIGDYINLTEPILVKHRKCNQKFYIHPQIIISKKALRCPCCETNKYKNNKYITIKEKISIYEKKLCNKYKILTPFINETETIKVRHICGCEFERTVKNLLKNKNNLICPKCISDKKLLEFKKRLNDKYNGEYETLEKSFVNFHAEMRFRHINCNKVFVSTPDKMLNKLKKCECIKGVKSREEKFKSKIYKKFKGEYKLVGEYIDYETNALFKHIPCGHVFNKKPSNFIKAKNPCPKCIAKSKSLGIEAYQKRLDKIYGKLYKVNGEYKNTTTELPTTCNKCNHVFMETPKNMLRGKKCPNCKSI